MNKAERIKRLTKGLMLLILAQAGYTLAVIVYQEQIQGSADWRCCRRWPLIISGRW